MIKPAPLGSADRLWIVEISQLVSDWLLNVRLTETPGKQFNNKVEFRVLLDDDKLDDGQEEFRLQDILPRHPQIFDNSTDGRLGKAGGVPVFRCAAGVGIPLHSERPAVWQKQELFRKCSHRCVVG
jgi:hypothetical protein